MRSSKILIYGPMLLFAGVVFTIAYLNIGSKDMDAVTFLMCCAIWIVGSFLAYGFNMYYWRNCCKSIKSPVDSFKEFDILWFKDFENQWNRCYDNHKEDYFFCILFSLALSLFSIPIAIIFSLTNYKRIGFCLKGNKFPDKEEFRKFVDVCKNISN